jgi:hypothetical protein
LTVVPRLLLQHEQQNRAQVGIHRHRDEVIQTQLGCQELFTTMWPAGSIVESLPPAQAIAPSCAFASPPWRLSRRDSCAMCRWCGPRGALLARIGGPRISDAFWNPPLSLLNGLY